MAGLSYEDYLKSLESEKEDLSYEKYSSMQPDVEPESTLEEKYLQPFVYPYVVEPTMKALGIIATPAQLAAAPINQALRATSQLIQGKPTDETINPLRHPLDYANKYGSFGSVLETLPVGNKPISEMLPETEVGSYLKEQFPLAAEKVKSITPNMIASAPVDITTMQKLSPAIAESRVNLEKYAESKLPSILNRRFLADQIISGHAKNKTLLNELKSSGKFDEVVDFFLEHPELNRVSGSKTLDELVGDVERYKDQYGRSKTTRSGGLISDLTEKQTSYMNDVPVNKKTSFEASDLQQRALENLDDMNLTHRSRQSAERFIREEIPVLDDAGMNKHPIDFADQVRKTSNKLMNDSSMTTDGIERSAQESAAMAMEKASREILDERGIGKLPDVGQAGYYENQQKLSNAMRLRDLYSGARVSQKGIGVPVGGLERGMAREALGLKSTHIDPFLLDSANRVASRQTIPDIMSKSIQSTPMTTAINVPNIQQQMMLRRGLVENLADYEIPRDSQQILANPKLALAKLAQATDNKALIDSLQDALEKHPDKLKTILPLMGMQFPNIFQADKYNRFDGKIFDPDPMMKQQTILRAYEDVKNRKDLSNSEKAILWDGLNTDGSLPQSFQ